MPLTLLSLVLLSVAGVLHAQEPPKLVVGIVVDQMRQEYLARFEKKFGEGGFKRLVREGFMLRNAHYNYVPTETGPGHASIYTGTTPALHGIIGNDWYDKASKREVNCVGDERQTAVGGTTKGQVSPWRNMASTITDELELATQRRAKVIGVSIKDRGAVLPAGHTPDGAYWFEAASGKFISSSYYKPALPLWVDRFNQQKLAEKFSGAEWKLSLSADQYTEVGPDDSPYETRFVGKPNSVFPYSLKDLAPQNGNYELLTYTPYGNDLVAAFAEAAIDGEALGRDEITDFLCVSFSSTDRIGHHMGPNSVEVEDTYIKLDRNIASLLSLLDKQIGVGQYLVFLTADHGVAEVPQYLTDVKVPAGYFRPAYVEAGLQEFLQKYFPGRKIVERISDNQVYFSQNLLTDDPRAAGVDLLVAAELISKYLLSVEGVAQVFTQAVLRQSDYDEGGLKGKVVRGHHPKRSGDLTFVLEPNWLVWGGIKGSTHGSAYTYDTHVPIIFFGKNIPAGTSVKPYAITDIAPTLSLLLQIKFPNACTGRPVEEIFEKR